MVSASVAEWLTAARLDVERACELLISPTGDALDRCQGVLERAVSELVECSHLRAQGKADTEIVSRADALRIQVLRAGRLLESAADFYRGWERILGAMSGGYTPGGGAAAVARRGRVFFRG